MKDEIEIYINPLTVNNIKLLLLVNALGITPNFHHVAINKGEQRKAEFLALNPEGKVPVLKQDELILNESNAIMQYLAASHNSNLWPANIIEQAKVLRVLFWQSNYFTAGVGPIAHRKVIMPFWGFGQKGIDDEQWQSFHQSMGRLESLLSNSSFVAGETLSIADISLAAFFIFHQQAEMPLNDYPKVLDWLATFAEISWHQSAVTYLASYLQHGTNN